MNARIHRGTRQIGGPLVELEYHGHRIVLDVGLPIEPVSFRDLLPDVDGLWHAGDGSLKGVFVTHGHPDHFGLADLVDPSVPIFMGEAAKKVLDAAAFFTGRHPGFECTGVLKDGIPIEAGAFKVTPMLVDHSGFDAYGLLVEAGGESLFYTGDVRFHGRKADRMKSLPGRLPEDLDCLLMEGTNFDRPARTDGLESEQDLENHLATSFAQVKGAAICFYSAQNIDRLVTVFKAAKRSGRVLVLDLYGATVAAATGRDAIPQAGWNDVRVYVREVERQQVKSAREFDRVDLPPDTRIYRDEIARNPSRFVITARGSSIGELEKDGCLEGSRAFWSQWAGYLDRDRRLVEQLKRNRVDLDLAHVSGHASTGDLVSFATSVGAGQTVPVHTDSPEMPRERIPSFRERADGVWWPVAQTKSEL